MLRSWSWQKKIVPAWKECFTLFRSIFFGFCQTIFLSLFNKKLTRRVADLWPWGQHQGGKCNTLRLFYPVVGRILVYEGNHNIYWVISCKSRPCGLRCHCPLHGVQRALCSCNVCDFFDARHRIMHVNPFQYSGCFPSSISVNFDISKILVTKFHTGLHCFQIYQINLKKMNTDCQILSELRVHKYSCKFACTLKAYFISA